MFSCMVDRTSASLVLTSSIFCGFGGPPRPISVSAGVYLAPLRAPCWLGRGPRPPWLDMATGERRTTDTQEEKAEEGGQRPASHRLHSCDTRVSFPLLSVHPESRSLPTSDEGREDTAKATGVAIATSARAHSRRAYAHVPVPCVVRVAACVRPARRPRRFLALPTRSHSLADASAARSLVGRYPLARAGWSVSVG